MAIGSDLGPLKEATLMEMGCWVRAGATPMQTIYAAAWPIVICFLFAMLMLYWAPWLTTFLPSLI